MTATRIERVTWQGTITEERTDIDHGDLGRTLLEGHPRARHVADGADGNSHRLKADEEIIDDRAAGGAHPHRVRSPPGSGPRRRT